MSENQEDFYIKNCLHKIEVQLNWGESQNWSNYDFEKLSSEIEAKTHIVLSVTTLKRIWGRVKYPHSPTVTTLNTLAQYLDYTDWRAFKQNGNGVASVSDFDSKQNGNGVASDTGIIETAPKIELPKVEKKRKDYLPVIGISVLIISLLSTFFILKSNPNKPKIDASKFQFEANKVLTVGVPNSVIFTYDAKAATTDSVFIVQTWDIRRKTLVNKNATHHSAIYYYPGYFKSKLIIDSQIVKTHDIQIATDGWLGLIEEDKPFYFSKKEIQSEEGVAITESLLSKNNFTLKPKCPHIRFFNQTDMGNLMNDDFEFETTVKNAYNEGTNVCQYSQILIQCKDDIIIIPLSAKACVGDINIYAVGSYKNAKTDDLSRFGADLTQWTTLKVICKNKTMQFFVNGILATTLTPKNAPTGIVGVQYRFNGVGAVKDTWFKREEEMWRL